MTRNARCVRGPAWSTLAAGALLIAAAGSVGAQTVLYACYVPHTGTVYRIKTANTQETCKSENSTAMGTSTTASGDYSTAMGFNANTLNQLGSFVYGDASTLALVVPTGPNQFIVRAAGGTRYFSSSDLSAGVWLAPGAGAWAAISDVNRKAHFRGVDGESVLARIARMPINEWSYKAQDPSIRHLGPTAQDFHAAFGLGESDTTITTTDIDGVNLLAVQALDRRTTTLRGESRRLRAAVAKLRAENRLLRAENSRQHDRLRALEARTTALEVVRAELARLRSEVTGTRGTNAGASGRTAISR